MISTPQQPVPQYKKNYQRYHRMFPEIPTILSSSLRFDVSADAGQRVRVSVLEGEAPPRPLILVDVRTPEERVVSTIPGSITPEDLVRLPLPDTGAPVPPLVVTYCTVGYRSGMAA
eukprot:CAMPEP_0194336936 /NCGR_PEP_ID=MMETSP0171-20130528/74629_1 /TAXON_ID=218684 /ORGANISM="Corethron pennatum, Strain L29A3" /LENGTH=115 /DNA_ID=CAMNT_0039100529 /DNA_START=28 /DNA_END=371 /DNA_ORIENTATION=-